MMSVAYSTTRDHGDSPRLESLLGHVDMQKLHRTDVTPHCYSTLEIWPHVRSTAVTSEVVSEGDLTLPPSAIRQSGHRGFAHPLSPAVVGRAGPACVSIGHLVQPRTVRSTWESGQHGAAGFGGVGTNELALGHESRRADPASC